jgi:hypothetical protein
VAVTSTRWKAHPRRRCGLDSVRCLPKESDDVPIGHARARVARRNPPLSPQSPVQKVVQMGCAGALTRGFAGPPAFRASCLRCPRHQLEAAASVGLPAGRPSSLSCDQLSECAPRVGISTQAPTGGGRCRSRRRTGPAPARPSGARRRGTSGPGIPPRGVPARGHPQRSRTRLLEDPPRRPVGRLVGEPITYTYGSRRTKGCSWGQRVPRSRSCGEAGERARSCRPAWLIAT